MSEEQKPVDPTIEPCLKLALFQLLEQFERNGLVVTVSQEPLQPLAMGNHRTVVDVRPARGSY